MLKKKMLGLSVTCRSRTAAPYFFLLSLPVQLFKVFSYIHPPIILHVDLSLTSMFINPSMYTFYRFTVLLMWVLHVLKIVWMLAYRALIITIPHTLILQRMRKPLCTFRIFWLFFAGTNNIFFLLIHFLFPFYAPLPMPTLCSSTKRKKRKKLKIKKDDVETDTKPLWQYKLCNPIINQGQVVIHILYTETTILQMQPPRNVQERNLCTFFCETIEIIMRWWFFSSFFEWHSIFRFKKGKKESVVFCT